MRNRLLSAIALTCVVLIPAIRQAYAATQTFDGTISDSMCAAKHMMPGKSDAECIQACVKYGSSYVLVSGGKVYTLSSAKPQTLAALAGKHVTVHGVLTASAIAVTSMEEAKSAAAAK
jgi:hypothetical protein